MQECATYLKSKNVTDVGFVGEQLTQIKCRAFAKALEEVGIELPEENIGTTQKRFEEGGYNAKLVLQVHDELNFNVPLNEVDKVREIVVSEMQHVVHLTVPLIADCGIGTNWLEAH